VVLLDLFTFFSLFSLLLAWSTLTFSFVIVFTSFHVFYYSGFFLLFFSYLPLWYGRYLPLCVLDFRFRIFLVSMCFFFFYYFCVFLLGFFFFFSFFLWMLFSTIFWALKILLRDFICVFRVAFVLLLVCSLSFVFFHRTLQIISLLVFLFFSFFFPFITFYFFFFFFALFVLVFFCFVCLLFFFFYFIFFFLLLWYFFCFFFVFCGLGIFFLCFLFLRAFFGVFCFFCVFPFVFSLGRGLFYLFLFLLVSKTQHAHFFSFFICCYLFCSPFFFFYFFKTPLLGVGGWWDSQGTRRVWGEVSAPRGRILWCVFFFWYECVIYFFGYKEVGLGGGGGFVSPGGSARGVRLWLVVFSVRGFILISFCRRGRALWGRDGVYRYALFFVSSRRFVFPDFRFR